MNEQTLKPRNFEENIIWYSLLGTYGLYYLGALYVWIPIMGWGLVAYLLWQWWHEADPTTFSSQNPVQIPSTIWVWILVVLGIEVALLVGHANFDLGLGMMIKSTINRWLRQWALFAIFPLLACLNIRLRLIVRGVCWVGLQSLGMLVLAILGAFVLKQPGLHFLSPFNAFGGGEIFYEVNLFGTVLSYGEVRILMFAPWAPALALIGNLFFWLASQEKVFFWRVVGQAGAIAMVLASASRLGVMVLVGIPILVFALKQMLSPWWLILLGSASFLASIFISPILQVVSTIKSQILEARAGSSRTRMLLQDLALRQWQSDAPIWGHGMIEPKGPRVVGFMPVGTHHQWFGTLYTHGIVGCGLLAIAFLWSFVVLLIRFWVDELAQLALALWFVLFTFTWGENLEALAYVIWPALIVMGMAYRNAGKENATA